jgi:hypothetical protein
VRLCRGTRNSSQANTLRQRSCEVWDQLWGRNNRWPAIHMIWLTYLLGFGAGEGNRTLVFSLEGCCSTIELHPRRILQGALADGAELIPFMAIPDGEVNAEPEPV